MPTNFINTSGNIIANSGNFTTLVVNGTSVSNFNSSVSGLLPTIANSGDNRILTSTGSTVGINAETNLTFDGTNLNLNNQTASTIASFDSSKNLVSLSTATYPSLTELSYVKGVTSALQTQIDTKASTSTTITAGSGLANGGSLAANRTIDVGQGDGISVSADAISVDSTVVRTTGTQTISGSKTFQPSTTFSSGITISNQTANTIASFDASSNVVSLSTSTYPSLTELSYVKGVTSALQTQIDGKSSTSHTHGNITSAGAIGSTSNLPLITTTAGAITVGSFGSTANTFCQGNDSRLSDSRAPTGSAGGDLTGTYPNPTLTTTGVTGGTYRSVTVDTKGRITAGTNPTTLAGYGITDVGNGTLTLSVSGTGLSGSASFTANQSGNTTFTVTSNATSANTVSTIVARDASGNFSAGTITATLNGNASTATTASNVNNGTLTLNVSGTGLSGSQTFTANQSGNATFTVTSNATSANTGSTIVARDASGNFSAGTITAILSGDLTKTAPTIGYTVSGAAVSYGGQAGPQILGQSGSGAIITFHRPGAYAINLGLDTDNQVKIGGWSFGAAAYKIVTADSRNSRGATRLYRNDSDTDYSVQTYWTGARWRLRGYVGDTYHAEAEVSYADSAGSATSATSATTATGLNSSNYIARSGSSGNANTDFSNTPAGTVRHNGDDANLTNGPGNAWWFYDNYRHSNASNLWGTQIAWGWEDNANRLAQRNVTGGSFGAWVYYLNSGNYNSYAPSLTGGGASGTWGINITGNAATATNGLTTTNYASNAPVSVRTFRAWGVYDGTASSANPGDGVNMGTMTRSGTATYTCNFAITLPNTNYGVLVSGQVGSMVTQTRNTGSVVIVAQNLNGVQTQATYFTVGIVDTI